MSWASSRRTLILVVIFSVVAAIAAVTLIATFYQTPSCNDGKRNQNEEGVDCGGACARVCAFNAVSPVVSFVRDVKGLGGRTDIVAYVENPNGLAAAKDAPFSIEVYDEERTLIATKQGTVDLPPGSGVPLYFSNVYAGGAVVAQVFLQFDTASLDWYSYTDTRIVPRVSDIESVEASTPRVRATLRNPSVEMLRDVLVIATVFDAEGNAIAATQTVVSEIPPQGSAPALFTFGAPFSAQAARIDVRPVVPLP